MLQLLTRREREKQVIEFVKYSLNSLAGCFGPGRTNSEVYREVIEPIISECSKKTLVMAYGSSGTGKTFTLFGSRITNSLLPKHQPLSVPPGLNDLDVKLAMQAEGSKNGLIYYSLVDSLRFGALLATGREVYQDKIFDLLGVCPSKSAGKIAIRELTTPACVIELLTVVLKNCHRAPTKQNSASSRGHVVIEAHTKGKTPFSIAFVDLAGSEPLPEKCDKLLRAERQSICGSDCSFRTTIHNNQDGCEPPLFKRLGLIANNHVAVICINPNIPQSIASTMGILRDLQETKYPSCKETHLSSTTKRLSTTLMPSSMLHRPPYIPRAPAKTAASKRTGLPKTPRSMEEMRHAINSLRLQNPTAKLNSLKEENGESNSPRCRYGPSCTRKHSLPPVDISKVERCDANFAPKCLVNTSLHDEQLTCGGYEKCTKASNSARINISRISDLLEEIPVEGKQIQQSTFSLLEEEKEVQPALPNLDSNRTDSKKSSEKEVQTRERKMTVIGKKPATTEVSSGLLTSDQLPSLKLIIALIVLFTLCLPS